MRQESADGEWKPEMKKPPEGGFLDNSKPGD